jgi:hypothetical protein
MINAHPTARRDIGPVEVGLAMVDLDPIVLQA